MTVRKLGILAAIGAALCAPHAQAFVLWGNSTGATPLFTYSGGGSNLGLFGTPNVVGNTFQFNPTSFVATSVSGAAATTTDQLQVHLTATAGNNFTLIRITETGTYSISGTGLGSVSDSGSEFITDLVNARPTRIASLLGTPAMPISGSGLSGNWSSTVQIDLTQGGGPLWTDIMLNFTNTLQATSQAGVTATIRKDSVTIEILPTPGGTSLFALAALTGLRRRRR
jgi:hypothetical protein